MQNARKVLESLTLFESFSSEAYRKKMELKKFSDQNARNVCKSRSLKSIFYMFNFYVVLACHDVVTDTGRATKYTWKVQVLSVSHIFEEKPRNDDDWQWLLLPQDARNLPFPRFF